MRRNRNGLRRAGSVILAVWLCIALIPFNVFAEGISGNNEEQAVVSDQDTDVLTDEDLQPDTDVELQPDEDLQEDEPEAETDVEQEQPAEEQVVSEPKMAGETAASDGECAHTFKTVAQVPATCQHSGRKAYRQCTKCGIIYDYSADKEVDEKSLIIPVAAHKWDAGTVISKPTIDKNGIKRHKCTVCGTTYNEEVVYNVKPAVAKNFKLNGRNVLFKSPVTKTVMPFMKEARISHIWIKAAKSQITVSWDYAKKMQRVDGIIILRKAGNETAYKEIKRIPFRKYSSGVARWSPSKSYTDKTANKKNVSYTYIVVSYFSKNGYTYISNSSEWAAGRTTASKLKNAYTAKINKKTDLLQVKDSHKLTLKHSRPKKIYNSKSFRWYSDNPKVAKVNSKGVVTGVAPGNTVIRGRLPSGCDVICKVRVVGAFKPSTSKIWVDVADTSSITLVWKKSSYTSSYDLYRSDDGSKWKKPIRVKGTTKKVTGLKKGHKYYFYVVARNDRNGYTALSNKSNIVTQKAVIKRRPTSLTGWPTSSSKRTGTTFSTTVKIGNPDGRKAKLQMYENRKWVTKKTLKLPSGAGTHKVKVVFPDYWWGQKSTWRLVIPRSTTSDEFITKAFNLTATRKYQNPSKYVQISDSISKHGYDHYVSKVLVNSSSTRSDHVEALIKTANKYKGETYVNGRSGAPGKGIDASGLVIQACYGAGVDLWPISPSTRPSNCVPKIMNSKLASRTYTADHVNMNRGDLIFFYTGKNLVGHVAIYLGYGKIIHASMVTGYVENSTIDELIKPIEEGGQYGYSVAGVRRIFN